MTLVEAIQRKLWEADPNSNERSWGFVGMKRRGEYIDQARALAAYFVEHFTEHAEELGMKRRGVSWPKLEGDVPHTQPCAVTDAMIAGEDMHTCGYKRGHFRFYPAEQYETTLVVTGPAWEPGARDQDAAWWLVNGSTSELTSPEDSH
jgi:hypothetical protein